jgi:hypothetical protein
LQPAVLEIVEDLSPHRLGRTEAHRVGMGGRFLGHARRMQPAEDHLRPAAAPGVGQLVGPAGRGDVRLDAHQVHVDVHLGRFHVLVADQDLPAVRRGQAGDGQQAQRREPGVLDQPVLVVVKLLQPGQDQ